VVNINSKSEARKRVREAQNKANEARLERERQNVDDAALFLVELGRLAGVDEWEQNRIVEIRAEGERRRHEHRQAAATVAWRMKDRGETLAAIAELAGVKVGDVRTVLNAASALTAARPDALGAASGATSAADGAAPPEGSAVDVGAVNVSSVNGAASQALDADKARTDDVGEVV
jgi:hypothetical protein